MPAGAGELVQALRDAGLIDGKEPLLEPLTGGVSCDVWKLDTAAGSIVVKRPLAQLRVTAEWTAPVERGESEVRWLRRAREVEPSIVPKVLAELSVDHAFAMEFIPDCPVWKDELVAGRVDVDFAARVGSGIAAVHRATANNATDRDDFPNDEMFRALRVDPFLIYVAERDPELSSALRALADDLMSRKIALVHGDVSPKNILVNGDNPVFIDAECAVYSDPAFDLAFCVTHLLLKSVWLDNEKLLQAAAAMVNSYRATIDWEIPEDLLQRAGRLTGALLLARIEGKSPAPYLTDKVQKNIIRAQARALILDPLPIDNIVTHWTRSFA